MTDSPEFARECARIGELYRAGKLLNPYKLWKLTPPAREPEPNRKVLT